ncbi:uncharacterized protein LOC117180408 [Belonocnema kinseyi]|uniref:uncharacterized protein LOC117180408 n=1 Tax=Belonocnema kinseyi TaxID=2817044 RepID=UPI00143D2A0A|nr:uncharacterized protein LOC117180408 [Belonocnema kinseyi]
MYILLKGNIQTWEVDLAKRLLHAFVVRTEILYSKVAMTCNVNSLIHLARSVYDWGPLWSHNAFAFESGDGDLLKVVHAAKGVRNQICSSTSLKYSMLLLKEQVDSCLNVKRFLIETGTTMVQKTLKFSEHRYFGSTSNVSQFWVEKLQLSSEKALSYKKLVKERCLYMSSIKNNKPSDNTFAQLRDGRYAKLNYFIIDSDPKKEYTILVIEHVHTIYFFQEKCCMLRKIVNK